MAGHKKRFQSLSVATPAFTQPLEDASCSVGSPVTLECCVQGYPRPEVSWEKEGMHLGKTRNIQMERSGQRCVLFIKKCNENEAGTYTCVASNKAGIAYTSSKLVVTGFQNDKIDVPSGQATPRHPLLRSFRGGRRPDIIKDHIRSASTDRTRDMKLPVASSAMKITCTNHKPKVPAEKRITTTSTGRTLNGRTSNHSKEKSNQETVTSGGRLQGRHRGNRTDAGNGEKKTGQKTHIIQQKKEVSKTPATTSNGHILLSTDNNESRSCHAEMAREKLENDIIHAVYYCQPKEGVITMKSVADDVGWENCWSDLVEKKQRASYSTVDGPALDLASLPENGLSMVSVEGATPARILQGPEDVTALQGDTVTLTVVFCGVPPLSVDWTKGGTALRDDNRTSISVCDDTSVLMIRDVTADDSGKYIVSVENTGGGDSHYTSVAVEGPPDPPAGETAASAVDDHSVLVSWYGATYDGGSVVTGYVLEMRHMPNGRWSRVEKVRDKMSTVVDGLEPGKRYTFRVRAENMYGCSKPSKESEEIIMPESNSCNGDEDVFEYRIVEVEDGYLFSERYELGEEVGKGRFGTVFRCTERETKRLQAAKVIRCVKSKEKAKVLREIDIMNRLHHPKLMQLTAAFNSGRNTILVMEYISGGELFDRLVADDYVLTEHDCILFMQQICEAICYIHQNHVLHLDMKPENILCKSKTSHQIKIIDFGLAQVYSPDSEVRAMFGTPEFVAPEVINFDPVTTASDMWSIGVICYVLLSGLSPFMGDSDAETFANITRAEVDFEESFEAVSERAKDFISSLLLKRSEDRMTAAECLCHPWLVDTPNEAKDVRLSTDKLKKFIIRRKWQKTGNAIRALSRMVSLSGATPSRSSVSSVDSDCSTPSPTMARPSSLCGSPHSSRKYYTNRSFTPDSVAGSDVFEEEDDPIREEGLR